MPEDWHKLHLQACGGMRTRICRGHVAHGEVVLLVGTVQSCWGGSVDHDPGNLGILVVKMAKLID